MNHRFSADPTGRQGFRWLVSSTKQGGRSKTGGNATSMTASRAQERKAAEMATEVIETGLVLSKE